VPDAQLGGARLVGRCSLRPLGHRDRHEVAHVVERDHRLDRQPTRDLERVGEGDHVEGHRRRVSHRREAVASQSGREVGRPVMRGDPPDRGRATRVDRGEDLADPPVGGRVGERGPDHDAAKRLGVGRDRPGRVGVLVCLDRDVHVGQPRRDDVGLDRGEQTRT
jgi:hypothetical protein